MRKHDKQQRSLKRLAAGADATDFNEDAMRDDAELELPEPKHPGLISLETYPY